MSAIHHRVFLLFLFMLFSLIVNGTYFRGGTIHWRPLNTTPPGSNVTVLIRQRYSWRRSSFFPSCAAGMIAAQGLIGFTGDTLDCFFGPYWSFPSISVDSRCTDFSVSADYSFGERSDTRVLTLFGGGGDWQMTGKIGLIVRPDEVINTSPIVFMTPIVYKIIGIQHQHVISVGDIDISDTIRYRWSKASANSNGMNECQSICAPSLPPGFMLFPNNCTLVFTLTTPNYYAVALQIEDYYTSTSTTPMSSVPLQFLFYGRNTLGGCSAPPIIIGPRPNGACIGAPLGILINETVIVQIGCVGKTIIDFITASPIGMIKTNITTLSLGVFAINLLWTPSAGQYGPQTFCAAPIDNTNVQGSPWCITFLVGFTGPNLQMPLLVQGSASPVGTIFSNHSIFSIQGVNGMPLYRPWRNGTYARFYDATLNGTIVLEYDCSWSPDVTYLGNTIIIYARYTWTLGHQYYLTFDSGVAILMEFCGAESAPVTDPNFWVFDIWDPGRSSTMTTTTTTTTTTVTTTTPFFLSATLRGDATTIPNPNLTRTGIAPMSSPSLTATTAVTTTSTTSLTTVTSTTTTSQSTTCDMAKVEAWSGKELVKACEMAVAVGTLLSVVVMIPIKMVAMFSLFTKSFGLAR